MPAINGWWFFFHPHAEQLAAYLDGGLGADEFDDVETHLVNCERCQAIVGRVQLQKLDAERRSDAV